MQYTRRKEIDSIANVINEHLELDNNFDIEMLVDELGGRIEYTNYINCDASISALQGDKDADFLIECRNDMPIKRKRFSLAHELGHLFMHMLQGDGTINSVTSYNRGSGRGLAEREADEFAAALLMPEEKFVEVSERFCVGNKYNLSKIADVFEVSEQACDVRGRILGLWV